MLKQKKYNKESFFHNNIMKRNTYSLNIIFSLLAFFVISMLSIYSAKSITSDSMGNIFIKQLIFYGIGVLVFFFTYRFKKEIIKFSFLWYIGFCFLLLVLLFIGTSINGSKCWLIMGPVSFQPSEFMKIALILVLAKVLDKYKRVKKMSKEFKMLLFVFTLFIIPAILTFLEPDTGVVIIYFIIMLSMLLFRGINKKWYFIVLILLTIIGGTIGYLYFFQNELLINLLGSNLFYRIERVLNWSNQSGYQLENSLIAIGSSGLVGFGFNQIPIYYPEASTDFIFTTFSSNFGFLGNLFFIIIILVFDINILLLSNKKIKKYDQYLLIGIFAMLLYQQVQNISMTIGLLPITGITLPFISYGGSSLLSYMFIAGLVLRISNDSKRYIN